MRSMPPDARMYLAMRLSTEGAGAWFAWARARTVTRASSIQPSWKRGDEKAIGRSRGRNRTRSFSRHGTRCRLPRIAESHRPVAPVDSAQAHDPARQADQHARLQAARERNRDAHGLRSDQGPAARTRPHRNTPRENIRQPGGGQEAHARPDPARRP